jgi:lambda family phage tail tape measure protein
MSETRAVTLETSVDTTGARAGFQEITREAGTMAASVARASQQADDAVDGIGTSAVGAARDVDASTRSMIGSIQRTTAQMQAGTRGSADYFEALARQRGIDPSVLQPYLAQLRAVQQEQGHTGTSAAQTANAMRLIPAQMTDIVTQLQGGQSPFTILLQQGGQLRDSFGSIGGTLRGVGSYLLGLVNPYTIAAAAAAGFILVYKNGRDEITAFNKAIITSGNAAGVTADQLSDVARHVGQISGSRSDAAAAINGLVQSGQVQAKMLQDATQATIDAQKYLGRAVEQTEAEFEKLGKSPLQGLRDIDDKYHNITASTYAQVKALQDQGRYAQAANVAQQAYADGITKQRQAVLDSMSDWERGWIRIKNGISGAIDSILHLRESTSSEKIGDLFKENRVTASRIERLKQEGKERDGNSYDPAKDPDVLAAQYALQANEREIKSIWDKQGVKKAAAAQDEKNNRAKTLRNNWKDDEDILRTRPEQLDLAIKAARTAGQENGLTEEEIQKRLKVVRAQYNDVYVNGIEQQIAALRRRTALEDLKSQPTRGQIQVDRTTGAISEDDATIKSANLDYAALDRQNASIRGQIALVGQMRASEQKTNELLDLRGQLQENVVQRKNREAQLSQDLLLTDLQRNRAAAAAFGQTFNQQYDKGQDLRGQVQQQRDYNEQIGLGARELLDLAAARREEQATRLDQNADIAEGLDLTGELADQYRRQAQELRGLSAAERDGFVKQRDPYVNLGLSLKRYAEDAENTGAQIGDVFTNAFKGAEDAFANFVTTGKLSFKDLATSILADIARIEAKQFLGGVASSLLGSIGTDTTSGWGATLIKSLSGARAEGGPVNAGLSYLVGERGPEIFTPSSSGGITPNHLIGAAAGGGGGVTIQTNIQVSAGGATSTTTGDASAAGRALADMISAKAKEVVARETRQGGVIWKLQQGRG